MNIDILKVGYLETNCYILTKNNKSLIIDPGDDENFIVSRIKKLNTTPIAILLTHHHEDHTGCVKPLSSMYGIKVYDYNNLFEGNHQIEDFSFEVIYTKGHSATSVTYYFPKEKVMFVGDFIFYENIGRTDLPRRKYDRTDSNDHTPYENRGLSAGIRAVDTMHRFHHEGYRRLRGCDKDVSQTQSRHLFRN